MRKRQRGNRLRSAGCGISLSPAAGSPLPLKWKAEQWVDDSARRHVRLWVNLRVVPYVRQTQKTRFRSDDRGERAREYNDAENTIRSAVKTVLEVEGILPFKEQKIGFSASFWLRLKRVPRVRRWATIDDPKTLDLGNLEKALEDALQGVLIPNDKWIFERGNGAKHEGTEDAFVVEVWELEAAPNALLQALRGRSLSLPLPMKDSLLPKAPTTARGKRRAA